MHTLPTKSLDVAPPLTVGMEMHLALEALLRGSVAGEAFVDRPDAPETLIAWTGHVVYVAGKIHEEDFAFLSELLRDTVQPHLRETGREAFEIKYREAGWGVIAAQATPPGMEGVYAQRQYYELNRPDRAEAKPDYTAPRAAAPCGFRVVAVDAGLLAAPIEDIDALKEELLSERPSIEEFLRRSFGLAALKENRLAGWCTSEYNTGNRCEVGIGTQEPYRRQGLATAMGAAFLDLAHERGVRRVGWHCFARNQASIATALRLGLQKQADYSTWIAWFKS